MKKLLMATLLFSAGVLAGWGQTATVTCAAASGTYPVGTTTLNIPCTVTVAAAVVPVATLPMITSFTASPTTITVGSAAKLSWSVSGATTLTINGENVLTVTSLTVSPTATTTYVMEATNSAGTVSQSVTVTVDAAAPTPTGTALTACQDITTTGSYYLANDVSSAGTCFGIDANNIVLNLNGHTITYGTGGGTTPTPAIEAHDSWWNGSPNYTGTSYASSSNHSNAEIYGGKIVQSPNAAPFSSAIAYGEGTYYAPAYIHDLTATFQNQGAQFVSMLYQPCGTRIEHNTIYDNVTNIQQPGQGALSARSAFQGQVIYLQGTENNSCAIGDTISDNAIVGGPQGGIRTVDQNSTIDGNDISQNATYSNDWCVEISADGTTAENNNCHPKSGRGINIDASHVTVSGNTIDVTELKQNTEYNGCELDGTVGIRLESMYLGNYHPVPVGVSITKNTITAVSTACEALALDLVYLEPSVQADITGNVITTTNTGASFDAAFAPDDTDGTGLTITGNTISSMSEYFFGNWDGYNNFTIATNTWKGSPVNTVVADDGACSPYNGNSTDTCPVAVTIVDALPNKVVCGTYSEAKVTINGTVVKQCSSTQ